jgi:pilus assembly protein CpaF
MVRQLNSFPTRPAEKEKAERPGVWGRSAPNANEAALPEEHSREEWRQFKIQLHHRLIMGMDLTALTALTKEQLRQEVRRVADDICQRSSNLLSRQECELLVNEVLDETFGLGPLEALMNDPSVTDILINGPDTVYVERKGQLELTPVCFSDEAHLRNIVQRMITLAGRRVDESSPMVDARLPDGSRVNAIIPPLALGGCLVSIRRFGVRPIRAADLVASKSLPQEALDFLAACVRARLNVLISGGTGSGKTTLLNALSAFIPDGERVITIEDAAELRLQQRHVGRLETRPKNAEGVGEVTTRDLARNALRMRPDRIVIGECRGPEALDMLQAMNTGHEGSLTTVHANDTREALGRLEVMVGMAGFDLPLWVIRRQIASAIHVVVQVSRLLGGARKVVKVSEVTGSEGENYAMQDLFVFKQTGVDDQRRAQGCFHATGLRPHFLDRLSAMGVGLPLDLFERRILQPAPARRLELAAGGLGAERPQGL